MNKGEKFMSTNNKNVLETEETIEVLSQMHYALISSEFIAICETETDLWQALYSRKNYNCCIYALEDHFQLQQLLQQRYPAFFYSYNAGMGCVALNVPTLTKSHDGYYALHNPSQLLENSLQYPPESFNVIPTAVIIDSGAWAISGLNGYYVVNSINDCITVLMSHMFKFPMAVWCQDFSSACWTAQQEYVRRFYQRYSSTLENILLPPDLQSQYHDKNFNQREERLKDNEKTTKILYDFYKMGL